MDLAFTEEEQAFRQEVRQYLRDAVPVELRRKLAEGRNLSKSEFADVLKILNRKGVPIWPKKFGGAGWTPVQYLIFDEEVRAFPIRIYNLGVSLVGPVIYTFGNDAQKKHYLPRIINADDLWCQGFSEPSAGSDLASLKTRAVRNGDHYVVNGQKIWTTWAQSADWIICLVRTNPDVKKQQGISFLLIDMKTPGVTVRPIQLINGDYDEVNEVFFDNVRVPIENLVGEENKGWDYAKFLLGNERVSDGNLGIAKERIRQAKRLAAHSPVGERLIDDPTFREKVAAVEVQLKALEITRLRAVANASKQQDGRPAPVSSILKLKCSQIEQAAAELLMDVAGPYALPDLSNEEIVNSNAAPTALNGMAQIAYTYFYSRAASIYSGSSEIQKNIIAKAILGL
ncbi:acyl-CoA dehydrogenase family protein [Bradyrhizobium sp. LMG 9283]|uniref:acyl-CoA dehydrogenase family protein n=1 Tax=Bradyrhizobium sp. LMG 9283 TaxID=592064 RepID=UPI00388F2D66